MSSIDYRKGNEKTNKIVSQFEKANNIVSQLKDIPYKIIELSLEKELGIKVISSFDYESWWEQLVNEPYIKSFFGEGGTKDFEQFLSEDYYKEYLTYRTFRHHDDYDFINIKGQFKDFILKDFENWVVQNLL